MYGIYHTYHDTIHIPKIGVPDDAEYVKKYDKYEKKYAEYGKKYAKYAEYDNKYAEYVNCDVTV